MNDDYTALLQSKRFKAAIVGLVVVICDHFFGEGTIDPATIFSVVGFIITWIIGDSIRGVVRKDRPKQIGITGSARDMEKFKREVQMMMEEIQKDDCEKEKEKAVRPEVPANREVRDGSFSAGREAASNAGGGAPIT